MEDAVCVGVGAVEPTRLYVSPSGNYNAQYNTLATAKFQLAIKAPSDEEFGPDFTTAIKKLEDLQGRVAKYNDRHYLIVGGEDGSKAIKLSAASFEKKVRV